MVQYWHLYLGSNQLDLRSTPYREIHVWHCKDGKELMAGEATDPKGEPTIVIFLNEYSFETLIY